MTVNDGGNSPGKVAPIPDHQAPLTIAEAAAFLNVTERWVRRAIHERRLPYMKLGHHVRLSRDDLRAYLQGQRVEPPTPLALSSPGRPLKGARPATRLDDRRRKASGDG